MRRHQSETRLSGEAGRGGRKHGVKEEGGVYSGGCWEHQQLLHTPQPQGLPPQLGRKNLTVKHPGTAGGAAPHRTSRETRGKGIRYKEMGKGEVDFFIIFFFFVLDEQKFLKSPRCTFGSQSIIHHPAHSLQWNMTLLFLFKISFVCVGLCSSISNRHLCQTEAALAVAAS